MDLLTFVFEREEMKGRYQNVQKCVGSCILAQLHTALLDGTLFRSTSTEEFKTLQIFHSFGKMCLKTNSEIQQACYRRRRSAEDGWRTGRAARGGLVSMAPERKTSLLRAPGHTM